MLYFICFPSLAVIAKNATTASRVNSPVSKRQKKPAPLQALVWW